MQPSYLRSLRAYVDQGKQLEVYLTEEEIEHAEACRCGLHGTHVHLSLLVVL